MDDATKARLRLYLRGERALGLSSVPAGNLAEAEQSRPEPVQPILPVKSPVQSQAPTTLFGSPSEAQSLAAEGLSPMPTVQVFSAPPLPTDEKKRRLTAINEN